MTLKRPLDLEAYWTTIHTNVIDSIRIPNLPKCDGAIHIVGDSMYPLLKSGDIVLYKEMPVDMQHLFYGEMYLISYIIEGDAYVVVKYINRSPQGEPVDVFDHDVSITFYDV